MMKQIKRTIALLLTAALVLLTTAGCERQLKNTDTAELINVSYDPTRELYEAYNQMFAAYWEEQTGQTVDIIQSHGGSGKQALEVANGLPADVVTLALEGDVNAIRDAGLIESGYIKEFEHDSAPYTSTIVFLVRKGNPKNIQDWNDLLNEDIGIITPNPKTSGGARWNYLAAWYYFEQQGQTEEQIIQNIKTVYQNVLVLDSGARGAATSFVENRQGDVLLAWENEAFLTLQEYPDEYEIVIPSVSILCQPTVAVVDEVVNTNGTQQLAQAYLSYLYADEAQELAAQNYYRPVNETILHEYQAPSDSRTISAVPEDGKWILTNDFDLTDITHFGGWEQTVNKHFSDGGIFDQIYEQ